MAPLPPPSQQGKFRPKRPPKKIIRPGVTVSSSLIGINEGQSTTNNTSSVAFADSTTTSNAATAASATNVARSQPSGSSMRSPNRGRGMGGQHGRFGGGRSGGRGRGPAPQGQAFFTGGETKSPPPSATKTKASGGSTSGGGKKSATATTASSKTKDPTSGANESAKSAVIAIDTSTEEVVGELDTGVGGNEDLSSSKKKPRAKKSTTVEKETIAMDVEDDEEYTTNAAAGTSISLNTLRFTYDSDSSEEGSTFGNDKSGESILEPLELPFQSNSGAVPHATASQPEIPSAENTHGAMSHSDSTSTSPIFDVNKTNDWFLVQLPSRLPALQKNVIKVEDNDEEEEEVQIVPPDKNISEVVTPPVMKSTFDNSLENAAPGKIGKIVVYKSGKTVLVLDGPDGHEIRMNVNEGMTCSFHQEAVAIDSEQSNYVTLGDVKKSVVVSPDLNCILNSR